MKPLHQQAQELAPCALEALSDVLTNPMSKDSDRIRAAEAILDRGYGKPSQAVISIPATKQQAALLASMSDADLVAIMESKPLKRIQSTITVGVDPLLM